MLSTATNGQIWVVHRHQTPVPSLRVGQGCLAPLTTACAPPNSVYSEYVFGTSRNDKAIDNNGTGIISFKHNSRLTMQEVQLKIKIIKN